MHLFVVEDDPYWQLAISEFVNDQPEHQIVMSCTSLDQALHAIPATVFDLMIVDLGLPDGSGIEAIRAARRHRPDADILVATVFADEANVVEAIYAGATGYLLKESTPAQWGAAIEELRAGNSPIDPKIARHILFAFQNGRSADRQKVNATEAASAPVNTKLSPRELEVLQLVAKGFTLVEVASYLSLSPHTTRSHAKAIYRKLEVGSQGEAVFEASALGLI